MRVEFAQKSFEVKSIKHDSRLVEKGDLFVALSGTRVDGHNFITEALRKGAGVIVGEKDLKLKKALYIKVKDSRKAFSKLSSLFFKDPGESLTLIGVTGTDGKTTTSHIIASILQENYEGVSLISTTGAYIMGRKVKTGFHTTTPDPFELFGLLKLILDKGGRYVVLEVTSHALALEKLGDIHFKAGCLTNVTSEHLDFHGSRKAYISAKASLAKRSDVLFMGSSYLGSDSIRNLGIKNISFFKEEHILRKYTVPKSFLKKFPGEYNLENVASAIAVCEYLDVPPKGVELGLSKAEPPRGRFERVPNRFGINIIIDFAHTKNSLEKLLKNVMSSSCPPAKIITVFGCASERDTGKRPEMGLVSSKLSDLVILTSEDPRYEDVFCINREIKSGNKDFKFVEIPDRKKAIGEAIKSAKKGDWVLICGKGPEESLNIGGVELPWSDRKAVSESLSSISKV